MCPEHTLVAIVESMGLELRQGFFLAVESITLGLQIAQRGPHLCTVVPKARITHFLEAMGICLYIYIYIDVHIYNTAIIPRGIHTSGPNVDIICIL